MYLTSPIVTGFQFLLVLVNCEGNAPLINKLPNILFIYYF